MAIQINLTAEQSAVGAAFATAYARIVQVLYNLNTDEVVISVDIYADNAARLSGKNPIGGGTYRATNNANGMANLDANNGPGLKKVCYNYLKTLPEFIAGSDV